MSNKNEHWWYFVWSASQRTPTQQITTHGSTEIATPWPKIEHMWQLDEVKRIARQASGLGDDVTLLISNWIYLRHEPSDK